MVDIDPATNLPIANTPMTHNDGDYVNWNVVGPGTQTKRYLPYINNDVIDSSKNWWQQRRFVDKWIGIRLFSRNNRNNFVSLYTLNAHKKISYR